jgi:hypothetical protein
MRLHHVVLTFAAAAALAGGAAGAVLAGDSKQLKGADTGTFTSQAVPGTSLIETQDVASGNATYLGRYTMRASEHVDVTTLEVTDGAFTLTAANGDTIVGSYTGSGAPTATPGVITYAVCGPILGGTGRFAGVGGTVRFDGGGNLGDGTLFDEVTATLTFGSSGPPC